MALKTTPTIAICLAAGIAAGVGLARGGDAAPAPAAAPAAGADVAVVAEAPTPAPADGDVYGTPAQDGTPAAPATPAPAAAEPVAITIADFAFGGATNVAAGGSIAVTNVDSAPHTLTFDDGSVNTGNLSQGDTVLLTAPTAPGTYSFFCAIHPSMTGSIVVG
ncbi:MAG: cupredoxin domain-containing protein [Actinomycetota bacterium]